MILFIEGGAAGMMITAGFFYWTIGRHKRVPSLTKYVVFSISILILYTGIEMTVSTISGVSHPDLSTLIGSTFGGEILFCALIRIFKLKGDNSADGAGD